MTIKNIYRLAFWVLVTNFCGVRIVMGGIHES